MSILSQLNEAKTVGEVTNLILQNFPNWLVYSVDDYSPDYPHLRKNWEHICKLAGTSPKKIVLVKDIVFDDDHKNINEVAEYMTRNGYVVRRTEEFIVCPTCEKAIPCKEIWQQFRNKGIRVPDQWSNKCRNCN